MALIPEISDKSAIINLINYSTTTFLLIVCSPDVIFIWYTPAGAEVMSTGTETFPAILLKTLLKICNI